MRRLFAALLLFTCMVAPLQSLGQEARLTRAVQPTIVAAGDGTFRGKAADVDFPRRLDVTMAERTTSLVALGSGLRKKAFFKVYEGIAYAEENASLNADPYRALLSGSIAIHFVMHFLRDVGAKKIQDAWRDGFDKYLSEEDMTSVLQADKETFLENFARTDIKKGETIELTWLPDLGLFMSVAGEAKRHVENPRLAAAVFSNWFSDKPISGGLKKDLVRFLEQ
ncbi:MAG: chalcone isomerase family protein [Candidatus Krumholzibacteria bacterium]|nr:chalcone isomerase family protein [Candidatus Krumholzibacteria bacterium]